MKPDPKRLKRILAIAGCLSVVAGLMWLLSQQGPPASAEPGYYTGVRYNPRNGLWVDEAGHVSAPPAGQANGERIKAIQTESDTADPKPTK